jgi:ribosome-binding factor A
VEGLIQRVLSEFLQKTVRDPRLKMTVITAVKVTRDLRIADIYFSTSAGLVSREDAEAGFKSAAGYIKRAIAPELGLRYMPELRFFYDESFDYGERIDRLLDAIRNHPQPKTGPDAPE